ncbi:S-adenosyl-L-methionine-dependent methyltransferase [Stipitochalara longipes BDJ]|nr:S-adenosyl-L-methionine-dependent methyltransferase [Stipitochalara longipes BDJ]
MSQISISKANSDDLDSLISPMESLVSIDSSIWRGLYENERRYHSQEQERYEYHDCSCACCLTVCRMYCQHAMISKLLGNLFLAPLPNPKHVIDYGTGTGTWAIEVAETYPEAHVTGIDLSPIQPFWVPPNVQFIIDDFATSNLGQADSFDLVHCCLGNAFSNRNWEAYLEHAYRCLAPGGWFEIKDFDIAPMCDDGTLPRDSAIVRWHDLLNEGASQGKINLRFSSAEIKTQAEKAGFVNVVVNEYKIPIGRWTRDRKLKLLGTYQKEVLMLGLEAFSLAILTRVLGWLKTEVDTFLEDVRHELKTSSYHWYWPL